MGKVYLKDYQPSHWLAPKVALNFAIDEVTTVTATTEVVFNEANYKGESPPQKLALNGATKKDLKLVSVCVNGHPPQKIGIGYRRLADQLVISANEGPLPASMQIEIVTSLTPEDNTQLMGLYKSSGTYCTQCEPEGFRRITFALDRPDVLSVFSCRIEASTQYTSLLANGNLVESGPVGSDKHFAQWEDPFPKPTYLFCLVVGRLNCHEDFFVTASGRKVTLRLFAQPKAIPRLLYAVRVLKEAMRWDEEAYGREYDLDLFMIVAIDDFNFGAMENKGLNVFNSSVLLADPDITTDAGYLNIKSIVGHEYFHNWSGNKVTLRDWFQLSLKEGFTVFRDQSFSEETGSFLQSRLASVHFLRTVQFKEDAGELSHCVRPESYSEINNFYTATVYEKGAEIVRLLKTLIGAEKFREGSDAYFAKYDGQAVCIEDFLTSFTENEDFNVEHFLHWYSTCGTPQLHIAEKWYDNEKILELSISQSNAKSVKGTTKGGAKDADVPLLIPVRTSFWSKDGKVVETSALNNMGVESEALGEHVLCLANENQTFQFRLEASQKPVTSILKGFSAPVKVTFEQSESELVVLAEHEDDPLSRWEAMQRLMTKSMKEMIELQGTSVDYSLAAKGLSKRIPQICRNLLANRDLDAFAIVSMLTPPEGLHDDFEPVALERSKMAQHVLLDAIAKESYDVLQSLYENLSGELRNKSYTLDIDAMRHRSLALKALDLLARVDGNWCKSAFELSRDADNLTERLASMRILVNYGTAPVNSLKNRGLTADRVTQWANEAIKYFEGRFIDEPLAMDYWFSLQASRESPDVLKDVQKLESHKLYNEHNPNRVRALVFAYVRNLVGFHRKDGQGYEFIVERILRLDSINPMLSARLATAFSRFRHWDADRCDGIQRVLTRLRAEPNLSPDLSEQVQRLWPTN